MMNKMNLLRLVGTGLGVSIGMQPIAAQNNISNQIQINWRPAKHYDGDKNLDLVLVLKNISNNSVDLKGWDLWFNSMFPVLEKKTDTYQFTNENGNLFKLQLSGQKLQPNDSLVFDYKSQFPIANISTAPNGFYLRDKVDAANYVAVNNVIYGPICRAAKEQLSFYSDLYAKNEHLNQETEYSPVFPTPKFMQVGQGKMNWSNNMTGFIDPHFNTSKSLHSALETLLGRKLLLGTVTTAKFLIQHKPELTDEAYELKVDRHGIQIVASTEKGVFYAIQSLKSMLIPNRVNQKQSIEFPFIEIKDEPRFSYRGFMLDIARNFKSKETVLKYLDIMSAYKLNVFHFHLIDDEGWRIEIKDLPELTTVGARRSPSFENRMSIHPAYGSGAHTVDAQYLTRADFVEILKYAHDRFITVVPEIETPGHSRAAIKAMESRYYKLKALGQDKAAEEFLLSDLDDKSIYNSAQNFTDNVLNPALPSVYTFLGKVLDEFKSMYAEAGVPFTRVSLGGDEVPNGVWEKSPKIKQLMNEKGFTSVHDVWPYYINRVNQICLSRGLVLAGWEEIGMVNNGQGMVVNTNLPDKTNMQLDVWNNVIAGGHEDLAYRLANAGYPTVLISASNMYFDMMWNTNFEEPGLKWATYADLYHSFSLLPEDYFANIDTYYSGKSLGKVGFKDRVRLNAEGKRNLIGIKGGLFAETVLTEKQLDYLVFPRFFTLVERAWSPKRAYEDEVTFSKDAFDVDYRSFINRIAKMDLPKLGNKVQFRLPAVGVRQAEGVLFANLEYPGFTIYYTTDGSAPTKESNKYNAKTGVPYRLNKQYKFAVIDGTGKVGPVTSLY